MWGRIREVFMAADAASTAFHSAWHWVSGDILLPGSVGVGWRTVVHIRKNETSSLIVATTGRESGVSFIWLT